MFVEMLLLFFILFFFSLSLVIVGNIFFGLFYVKGFYLKQGQDRTNGMSNLLEQKDFFFHTISPHVMLQISRIDFPIHDHEPKYY